jgi:ectoine hydroxylase-related dioxygenase (phytanoyl-CoA dioxygenase family)
MEFDAFHREEVPRLLAAGQGRAAAHDLGAGRSLALRVPERGAYTYRSDGEDMTVDPGDEDAAVIAELAADAFADLVSESRSIFGLLYADRVAIRKGTFDGLARWEAPLQALWFGRPIYGPDAIAAVANLELSRTFTLDDDNDEIAAFLSTAGFVVLRQVFDQAEIDELNRIAAEEKVKATPGDQMSWWATRADGVEVCCRLTYMAKRSDHVASLAGDPRMVRIAAMADARLQPCLDRLDGVNVVIKNPEVVAGLSDLPWHRDCGMGGHPVLCPGLNVGIQLDRADAGNGQLHYLAGSHHHAAQQGTPSRQDGVPVVAVQTEPGDVTVHFGHTLHAAPPPTAADAGRKVMYVGYHIPEAFDVVGAGQSYNDVLVAQDAKSVAEFIGS